MNIRSSSIAAVIAAFSIVGSARADLTPPVGGITGIVTAASAPNAFGSPSYNAWVTNAIQAQYLEVSSFGTPGTPTYYQAAPSVMSVYDNIVTGFNSWHGQADPGTVFGAPFSAELGNRLSFGLHLYGNGAQISIDQVGFAATSSDPGNSLGFSFGTGSYNYSTQYVGIQYGVDGLRGTSDDVWITGGPASQLVDEIIGRGSGNAWAVYGTDPGATNQDKIDIAVAALGTDPIVFTGEYTYGGTAIASDTVTFNPTSVPDGGSTMALMCASVFGMMLFQRPRLRQI